MSGLRVAVRSLGELLITLGVLILLYVAYQLFWTNVTADQATHAAAAQLRQEWSRPLPPPKVQPGAPTPTATAAVPSGDAMALMYIPRLGKDWVKPVVQGVALSDLARGIGHYPSSALPGQVGNFAVAGHRATHGQPLAYIDKIRDGDIVVVETRTEWFTYVVDRHFITEPTSTWVIDPVPGKPGATPTQSLITITSCNPRWASYQRWIIFGHLVSTTPRVGNVLPPSLAG